jgi:hypothetical protein
MSSPITPDIINNIRGLLVDFMPNKMSVFRKEVVEGPGGQTETSVLKYSDIPCRLEELPRIMLAVQTGGRIEDLPNMQLACPVGTDVVLGDEVLITADVMGLVPAGDRYQVVSSIPPESYDVEKHVWLKWLQP